MLFGTILLLALGKVEPAAGRCPGESALALPVESAAGRLLCPMPSGRCPGQGGTGRGPMPWESALALPVESAAGRFDSYHVEQGKAQRKRAGVFTLPVRIRADCVTFRVLRPSLPYGKRVASLWAET